MDISLFTQASTATIPAGIDLVETSGYSIAGRGAGQYVADNAVNATYVSANPRTSFISANGRGFRLTTDQTVTPYLFGVLEGVTDDTVALQAFADFVSGYRCSRVDVSCGCGISSPIVWGPGTGGPATRYYTGRMALNASATMDYLVYFRNQAETVWNAELVLSGTGGAAYASRGCINGVVFDGCSRMRWTGGGIRLSSFKFAGVAAYLNNNSFLDLGFVRGFYCGSGAESASLSLQANWSNPTNGGSVDSGVQYTRLNVDALPDAAVTGFNGSPQVRLNGRPYLVKNFDRTNMTVDIFPWLDTRIAMSGILTWIWGGLVYLSGADCNEVTAEIDAQLCARALATDALYGGVFKLSAQGCGQLIGAGLRQYGVHQPDEISLGYCENNAENIVVANVQNGDLSRIHIQGQHQNSNADQDWGFSPVHNATTFQPTPVPGMQGSRLVHGHNIVAFEKVDPAAYRKSSDPLTIDPNRNNVWVEEVNVGSRTINIASLSSGLRRNLGISGLRYVARGTGPNGAPTGTITWTATDGLAAGVGSLAFNGFDGPALFSCEYDPVSEGFLVNLLAGKDSPAVAVSYDPPNLAAGASDVIQTVTVSGAQLGDFVDPSFSADLAGARLEAWVSGPNTVKFRFSNPTPSSIDLTAGMVRLRLKKA